MTRLSGLKIKEIERKGQWKDEDPEVTGVETNSILIEIGYIFVAKAGDKKNTHGVLFSDQAFKRGASLVITDTAGYQFAQHKAFNKNIPFLLVDNPEQTLDGICEILYSGKPHFIMGITGTNGKTSVVNLTQQLIEQKNKSCVTIGTLGV